MINTVSEVWATIGFITNLSQGRRNDEKLPQCKDAYFTFLLKEERQIKEIVPAEPDSVLQL